MPVYKNYLNDYRKNSKKKEDLFSVPKSSIKSSEMEEERRNNIIDWVTLYRRNVHLFVSHYFGIKLYFFQKIWIYLMGTRDSYVAIASRGVSKTWLLAVLALARAVLYPGSEIVLVAATKQQAGTLVEDKVTSLRDNYPNIAREIKNLTTNMNKWQVDFHNGSVIRVVAARDSSRGKVNYYSNSLFTILNPIGGTCK